VLAGIRNTHAKPPVQKEAILPDDLLAVDGHADIPGLTLENPEDFVRRVR